MGGGSLTALPIVETMGGDISTYIPTNIISITDGQIFLETELFHSGMRPAINLGLSVSRVGRVAQAKALQKVSGKLRIELAQYRELSVFTQFGSDIDPATHKMLVRGEHLMQLLKQEKHSPIRLSEQVATLLAFNEHVFEGVASGQVKAFQTELINHLKAECAAALDNIEQTGDLSSHTRELLLTAMHNFTNKQAGNA